MTELAKTQLAGSVDIKKAAAAIEIVKQRVIEETQRWRTEYEGESNTKSKTTLFFYAGSFVVHMSRAGSRSQTDVIIEYDLTPVLRQM